MASTCENYLADIVSAHTEADWIYDTYLEDLKDWFYDEYVTHTTFDQDWRLHISNMVTNVTAILKYLIHGNYQGYQPHRLPYYLSNCISLDFNMDTLISTMLTADPDQVEYFVGLVDAYRQSVWNRPFNEEFFAALARGFMLWP